MNEATSKKVERLEHELSVLREEYSALEAKGAKRLRLGAKIGTTLGGLAVFGPRLAKAIENLIQASRNVEQFPAKEVAEVVAAVVRRLLAIGLVALIPLSLVVWQNLLMADQNQFFRQQNSLVQTQLEDSRYFAKEQNSKLQLQLDRQHEQETEERRSRYLEILFGQPVHPLRLRAEAAKAFVALERSRLRRRRSKLVAASPHAISLEGSLSLVEADLARSNLSYSDLSSVRFDGADLRRANLSNTKLMFARMERANLTGASLFKADIQGVTWNGTICPNGEVSSGTVDGCDGKLQPIQSVGPTLQTPSSPPSH
jgi:hypothetical protein